MSISLDTITTNTTGGYLGHYPARPVWGYVATTNGTAPASSNYFYLTFSAKNPTVPMTVDYGQGSSQSNVGAPRAFGTAEDSTSTYFSSSSGTQTSSESYSPSSGYTGAPYLHQTGSYAGVDAFDNGHHYMGRRGTSVNTNKHFSGIVVGESKWNQTYDLLAFNGKIFKRPVKSMIAGTTWQSASVNQDFFFVSQQMWSGTQYSSPSGVNVGLGYANPGVTTSTQTSNDSSSYRNYGMICHNRNTGKIAYLENRNAGTATFRLHILDIQMKIGKSTTTKQIFDAWDAAVDAGGSRYAYHDFTLPSWSNGYTTDFQSQQIKVILCDDDSMWLVGWDHSNGSSGTFRLYRNTTAGSYTSWTQVSTISTTTSYNGASGAQYGTSHYNSDDNSRVVVFVPYYYYHSGLCSFVLDTASSIPSGTGNEDVHWMQITNQDSNGGYFIVPCGGANFVYHRTYQNADGGAGAQFTIVNTKLLRGHTFSWSAQITNYPTWNQSTTYQGWQPYKIQPTLEWKPDDEPYV